VPPLWEGDAEGKEGEGQSLYKEGGLMKRGTWGVKGSVRRASSCRPCLHAYGRKFKEGSGGRREKKGELGQKGGSKASKVVCL